MAFPKLEFDLKEATVTTMNQHYNFQELLHGAIGAKDAERRLEPQSIPVHAAERGTMLRNSDITDLSKYFGDQPAVQGVIAGIAVSADQFEIRQAAVYAIVRHNSALADLVIEVSLNDSDSTVREDMLLHLCRENPLLALSTAVGVVRYDPDESFRVNAIELLLDLDTARAIELAQELVAAPHDFSKLRDFCQQTIERTDLEPYVKETHGHLISQETVQRAALLSAALFEEAADLCLNAAEQYLAKSDNASAVAIGYALLSHRIPKLKELGYQTLMAYSPEIAELLP